MKRYATAILLLLALGLIVLGAFLPKLASRWLFPSDSGKVSFIAVSDIQLEFDSDGQQPGIPEKMAMLVKYADTMELPDSMATLNDDGIFQIVQQVMADYQQAALLPVGLPQLSKRSILDAQPYMLSWELGSSQGNIFWNVTVELAADLQLYLIIDDQTGTVCSISCTQTVPGDLPQTTGKAHLQSQMNALCQLFLTELGAEFSQYDPSAIAKNAYSRTDNVLIASMSWSDILYGEVTINFSVTANQFSVRIL